jgi:hypothetical protein
MYQQRWGYKVEDKLYLGVREQKRLNITGLNHICTGLAQAGAQQIGFLSYFPFLPKDGSRTQFPKRNVKTV